jgi:hypothetical protein
MSSILISGIVAGRDLTPYVQIDIDGRMAQLTMAQARNVARDIERQCSRAEADAMIYKFFAANDLPTGAVVTMMKLFRDFREMLDREKVETSTSAPDEREKHE